MTRLTAMMLALLLTFAPGMIYAQDASPPVEAEAPQETPAPSEVSPAEPQEVVTEPVPEKSETGQTAEPAAEPVVKPAEPPVAEPKAPKEPAQVAKPASKPKATQGKVGVAVMEPDLPEELLGVTKAIVNERLHAGLSAHYEVTPVEKTKTAVNKAQGGDAGLTCPSEPCDGKLRADLKVDRLVFLEATQEKVTLKLKLTMRRSAGNLTREAECSNCTSVELESKVDELVAELVATDDKLPPQPEAMAESLPDESNTGPQEPGFSMPIWGWALAGGAALLLLAAMGGGGGGGKKDQEPTTGTIDFTW